VMFSKSFPSWWMSLKSVRGEGKAKHTDKKRRH
jgi:hypothetical protein